LQNFFIKNYQQLSILENFLLFTKFHITINQYFKNIFGKLYDNLSPLEISFLKNQRSQPVITGEERLFYLHLQLNP